MKKQFVPRISKPLLDRLVNYLNDRPYREVAQLLSDLYSEVQVQVPKPPAIKVTSGTRKAQEIINRSNGHYAKAP